MKSLLFILFATLLSLTALAQSHEKLDCDFYPQFYLENKQLEIFEKQNEYYFKLIRCVRTTWEGDGECFVSDYYEITHENYVNLIDWLRKSDDSRLADRHCLLITCDKPINEYGTYEKPHEGICSVNITPTRI